MTNVTDRHTLTGKSYRRLLTFPLDEILTVFENNHIDPPWSHVLALGLDTIAIVAVVWCLRQVSNAQRAARQARRFERSGLPLYEGARFVAGYVELAEGAKTAIRVTIEQEGTEHEQKNGRTHRWSEVHRNVEAVPFYLRTATGERVRVEPPVDVMLVDKLDQMEWTAPTHRRRRAEVTAGERAVIEGRLERGPDSELHGSASTYRSIASFGWIMKSTKRRGMHVSTENLSRRHELRERAFIWTTVWAAVFGLVATAFVLPYHLRLLRGKNVAAQYINKQMYQTRQGKGGVATHYGVNVQYVDDGGQSQRDRFEIDVADYNALPYRSSHVWLRVVSAHPWATTLGKSSSVASWQMALATTVLGFGIYRIVRTHRHRRWYEGHLVEHGSGVLPPPPNTRFADDAIQTYVPAKPRVAPDVEPISTDFQEKTEGRDERPRN